MSEPTNSTWKIEFPPFDLRALLRLAIWGCAASGALMVAVISAYSTAGSQRTAAAAPPRDPPQLPAVTAQLVTRAADMENETRRLSETVQALTADRDRLLARVASLERSLEDVTGSIKRQAAAVLAPPTRPLSAITAAPQPPTPQPPTPASQQRRPRRPSRRPRGSPTRRR